MLSNTSEFTYRAANLLFVALDKHWIRSRLDNESAEPLTQLKAVLESKA